MVKWGRGGKILLRKSVYVFLVWGICTAILNIAYTQSVITDAVLGNWTIANVMLMNHYLWVAFWFVAVVLPEMSRG